VQLLRYAALSALGLGLLCALPLGAQAPEPEITVTSRPYSPHTFSLSTESNEVQVAAVVRDSGGKALLNLSQADFQVLADGMPQPIRGFRKVEGPAPAGRESTPVAPLVAGVAATETAAPQSMVLFIDDNSMTEVDDAEIRQAARKFFSRPLAPGLQVAIVTASGTVATGFTHDIAVLRAAATRLLAHPRVTPQGAGKGITLGAYLSYMVMQDDNLQSPWMQDAVQRFLKLQLCLHPDDCQALVDAVADETVEAARQSSSDTLSGLEQAIQMLSGREGQRTLLLASSGFLAQQVAQQQQRVTEAALRANVVINSLEAQMLSADLPDPADAALGIDLQGPATLDAPLSALALGTGGQFINNTNDLSGWMGRMAAPEARYLLSIAPAKMPADGKYHKLKVTVAVPRTTVSARPGYYDPSPLPNLLAQLPAGELDKLALSSETVTLLPAEFEGKVNLRPGLLPELAMTLKVDPTRLEFHHKGGRNRDGLVFLTAVFDRNGRFVLGQVGSAALALRESSLEQLAVKGIHSTLKVALAPGAYRVREVVRESNQGLMTEMNRSVVVPR
jgi:VWFA-related protein